MSNEQINGTPTEAQGIEQPVRSGVVIASVPVDLEGQSFFELELREPGIVRACSWWIKKPQVIASAMRGVASVPMPLLLVECKTDGELRKRRFFFVVGDKPLAMKPGYEARWLATAIAGDGAGHLFEVVEAAS